MGTRERETESEAEEPTGRQKAKRTWLTFKCTEADFHNYCSLQKSKCIKWGIVRPLPPILPLSSHPFSSYYSFFSQLSLPALYLISFLRLHPLSSKNFAISYRSSPSLLFNFLSSSPLVFSSICSRHPISRINLGTVHFCKTTDVEALHLRCNFRFL